MEETFKQVAANVALALEAMAIVIIAFGAGQALYGTAGAVLARGPQPIGRKKTVWLQFGMWLLLGLEFELGADIVRTAVSPTWAEIGQLGSIAVIRTFLNYFLERDMEKYVEPAAPSSSSS